MGKLKLMTIIGTRPEIIRLSATIKCCDRYFEQILVHTGQNYDYTLNQVFFDDLGLRAPDYYLDAVGDDLGATIGNIIEKSYKLMVRVRPDAVLVLGDTNSCLSVIGAKRLHIPIFHMEAGNRCKDECLPEETNRRIVDIISDVNLCYSEHARRYLMECGLPKERTFVTGSPMAEVLHAKPADLIAKAKGFTAELKEARQNVERMKEKILHSDVDRFLYASKNIGGIKVITTTRTDLEAGDLRKLGDFLRDKDPDTVAVLATATESKVTFVAVCGKNAVARGIRAGDLVRAVSAVTGGKGGGKPDSAMGGGSEVLKIDDALAIVDDFVAEKLGL